MKAGSIVAVSQLANHNLSFHIGLFPTCPLIPLPLVNALPSDTLGC